MKTEDIEMIEALRKFVIETVKEEFGDYADAIRVRTEEEVKEGLNNFMDKIVEELN